MSVLRRAIAYEVGMWRSLYRWVGRRPVAGEGGAERFSYTGVVAPILGVFIGLSAVEIPILDLILSHTLGWPTVRIIAVALGVYGLIWMIGLWASMKVHPHLVGESGLRVRNGFMIDVQLDWDAIAQVRHRYRSLSSSRAVQVEHEDGGAVVLNIGAGSQTSVDVILRTPTSVPLPKGPSEPATELRFYADDPDGLVALARRHLAREAAPR